MRIISLKKLRTAISYFYITLSVVLLLKIVLSEGLSVAPSRRMFSLFLDKNFIVPFFIYGFILLGYILIIRKVLIFFFNSFIKLIGEDLKDFFRILSVKDILITYITIMIASYYSTIVNFVLNALTKVIPPIQDYLLGSTYSKIVIKDMSNVITWSNKLLIFSLVLIIMGVGYTMYLGTVKNMKIVRYNIVEPADVIVKAIPFLAMVIFLYDLFKVVV